MRGTVLIHNNGAHMENAVTQASANTPPLLLQQCRQRFLEVLRQCARNAGYRMPELLEILSSAAGKVFDELCGIRSKEEFERLRSLTASRISLVHPEDMDLTVAMINLTHNLGDVCERELPRLHLFFMSLLSQDSSVLDQLPVGPDAVCLALRALCDSGELPVGQRLNVPARLEPELAIALPVFYAELSELLSTQGVTAKSLLRPREGDHAYRSAGLYDSVDDVGGVAASGLGGATLDSGGSPSAGSPLSRLQDALLRRRGGGFSRSARPSYGGGGSQGGGGANPVSDPSLLAAIMDRVLGWLTERQREGAKLAAGVDQPQVNFAELNALLPAESCAALDAIRLSFDQLLNDSTLCAAARPALERLRLPVSKAALIDGSFLENANHPARCFLGNVLRLLATVSLDASADHPICLAFETTARRLQAAFDRDLGLFLEAATELAALEQARVSEAALRADKFFNVFERECRREQSRSRAARAVRALCAINPPEPIRQFLELLWVRVLAAAHAQHGEKSRQWVIALDTANRLVDSVQPKADTAAQQQLAASLPALLEEVRRGLDSIGTPEQLRDRAFHSFVNCHAAALRGRAYEAPMRSESSPAPARIDTSPDVPGLHLVRLAPEGEPDRDVPEWTLQIQAGDWVQLCLPAQTPQRLRVGRIGGTPRMALFTRADDDFVIICPLRWVAQLAISGGASPVVMEGIFERAAESATHVAFA